MNLKVCMLTKNDCYKAGRKIDVKGITVHSTGANNPNINRYVPLENCSSLHWNKPGLKKCVHAFVGYLPDGNIGTCQTLPWNHRGWHIGSGSKGSYNNSHIGFEICEDNLHDRTYFYKVMLEAAELCAYLCKMYELNPMDETVLCSHHEGYLQGYGGNHADIDHWLKIYNLTMNDFRLKVFQIMESLNEKDFAEMMQSYQDELGKLPYSPYVTKEGVDRFVDITDISDGSRPQQLITREQVMTMIKRYDDYVQKEYLGEGIK